MRQSFITSTLLTSFVIIFMVVASNSEAQFPIVVHLHQPPPTEICKNLKVELAKTSQGTSYKFTITNKDTAGIVNSHVGDPPPVSVRIKVYGDSILSIEGGVTNGWNRTPSKFPPGSSGVKWTNTSGAIHSGRFNLGLLKLRNKPSASLVTVTYEWLNKDDEVVCKGSFTITKDKATNDREK